MRRLLEGSKVSHQLNKWIDLVFGINATGNNARLKVNLYYYITYPKSIQFEMI